MPLEPTFRQEDLSSPRPLKTSPLVETLAPATFPCSSSFLNNQFNNFVLFINNHYNNYVRLHWPKKGGGGRQGVLGARISSLVVYSSIGCTKHYGSPAPWCDIICITYGGSRPSIDNCPTNHSFTAPSSSVQRITRGGACAERSIAAQQHTAKCAQFSKLVRCVTQRILYIQAVQPVSLFASAVALVLRAETITPTNTKAETSSTPAAILNRLS